MKQQDVAKKYWAVTASAVQSLFGDGFGATTTDEYFVSAVFPLFGAAVQAVIFGNVAMLMQNANAAALTFREHMDLGMES